MAGNDLKININTADVEQLTGIKGVGENIAERIVTYREENGPFRSVEDLAKVKGIGPKMMNSIRNFISVDDQDNEPMEVDYKKENTNPQSSSKDHNVREQMSEYVENMMDIFKPIMQSTSRPKMAPFSFQHKNERVVRIASWNVEIFDEEKASNPGVKEVVCMTILENGFGLIAFQELADEKSLNIICNELNTPTLYCTKRWSGRRGNWKVKVSATTGRMYRSHEYNGFLYDVSQGITLKNSALLEKPKNAAYPFTRKPFIGTFQIQKFDCIIASVHLKATGLNNEDLGRLQAEIDNVPAIYGSIEQQYPGEKDIMILGDFNLDPAKEDFDILRKKKYRNCIPAGVYTNISNSNLKGSQCYDHLWITENTSKVFTGNSGVVREGLRSAFIPKGWSFGGVVSDHCPVWAEIYTGQDLDQADLSGDTDFSIDG